MSKTIQILNQHHNQLNKPLVEFLKKNVPIVDETPWITAYNYFYNNWNVLGPNTQAPETQSAYIDYIMMVIFDNDSKGFLSEHSCIFNNNQFEVIEKYFNRLEKKLGLNLDISI